MGISLVLELVNPNSQHNLPETCFGNCSLQEKKKKAFNPVSFTCELGFAVPKTAKAFLEN